MSISHHRLGTIMCLTSGAAFGTMAIFGKFAYDAGVGVGTLLFARFGFAAIALWAAVAVMRRGERALPGRSVLAALALGGVGYALQAGLFFAALERMDASLLALVLYTYPAFVTAAAIAIGRETTSRRRAGALLVSSSGLVLLLAGARTGGVDLVGAAMGLGAALTYTAYILVSDAVTRELEPLRLTALVATGAAVTLGLVGLLSGSLTTDFAPDGWVWLGLLSAISTVGAILLFFAGLKRVGPSTAAILSTFEPVVTVALAFLAFGETLTMLQVGGAVLVLGAVIVLQARPSEPVPA